MAAGYGLILPPRRVPLSFLQLRTGRKTHQAHDEPAPARAASVPGSGENQLSRPQRFHDWQPRSAHRREKPADKADPAGPENAFPQQVWRDPKIERHLA